MSNYCSEPATAPVGRNDTIYNEMETQVRMRGTFGYTPQEWE